MRERLSLSVSGFLTLAERETGGVILLGIFVVTFHLRISAERRGGGGGNFGKTKNFNKNKIY